MFSLYNKNHPAFCNVKFKGSDGKTFYFNKLILATESDYFEALFRQEPEKNEFEIYEFDTELVKIIFECALMFDETKFTKENCLDLLKIADFYQMSSLANGIAYLDVDMPFTIENVIPVYEMTMHIYGKTYSVGHNSATSYYIVHTRVGQFFSNAHPLDMLLSYQF